MQSVCLYLHVHQPFRVKPYSMFSIAKDHSYFVDETSWDGNNRAILNKVCEKSYLPTLSVLENLLERHPEFTFTISFSGVVIDQLALYRPDVLVRFQDVVATGRVEILGDTYHHSLAFFYSRQEFERQVALHEKLMEGIFGITPTAFRNTELSYRNDLGRWADQHGYHAILTEGWEHYLKGRSPNFVYRPPATDHIVLLLKNYHLSDDIAFRFSESYASGNPLHPDVFAHWIHGMHGSGDVVNLFMDFETFGEHQWSDTGIFEFLDKLPEMILRHPDTQFSTPTQVARTYSPVDVLDVPHILSWADTERDLSAWTGNDIQRAALSTLYGLEHDVLSSNDTELIETWRRLQTSDHFYYMCTKFWNDGDVHKYFSPYSSPMDAYTYFMHVVTDLKMRVLSQ